MTTALINPIRLVALSGGKDSTAMALRLRELEPDTVFQYVCTPTGNELPAMREHWRKLERLLGAPLYRVMPERGLVEESLRQRFLPNARSRWCTRLLKIQPYIKFVKSLKTTLSDRVISYVGLRADEPVEERTGMFGDEIDEYRYPLREWDWGVGDVLTYLTKRGIEIPERTDCALCPYQRLAEWYNLWKNYPEEFQGGIALEAQVSALAGEKRGIRDDHPDAVLYSIRSPSRDTWPAGLAELGERFARGDMPRKAPASDQHAKCRVCSM